MTGAKLHAMVVESQTPPQVELPSRGLEQVEQTPGKLPPSPSDRTTTDPEGLSAHVWLGHHPVIQLREWATDKVHALPGAEVAESMIGGEPSASLRIIDPSGLVSRKHARLVREGVWWRIEDLRSKNGIRQDHKRNDKFLIVPGVQIGIGGVTLVAENKALIHLRQYLLRVLGWDDESRLAVDMAIQAIRTAANQRRPLVIGGADDLVAVARQIHLRTTAPDTPFVVCSDQPRKPDDAVRVTATAADPATAFELAAGGAVCVRAEELPVELDSLLEAAREPAIRSGTRLIICASNAPRWSKVNQLLVPPLARRTADDLRRIVAEYASEAIEELEATPRSFTEADGDWVVRRAAGSFAEIEVATSRIVARNDSGNPHRAAARLGLSHVGLGKWLKRRGLKT
jgi:hypothetical protein